MAEPKYKIFFDMMIKQNQELFDNFKKIHDNYSENPAKYKAQFNETGREVLDAVRLYENRLCNQSESSRNAKFSTNLSEKFQYEVKRYLPKIDFVGQE